MSLSKGQETAQAVLDVIRMNPETHNQHSWETDCGTVRCVGGWAIFLHDRKVDLVRGGMADIAADLLGITPDCLNLPGDGCRCEQCRLGESSDAYKLFYQTSNEEAIHALEYLAKGDKIDWDAVYGRKEF